ncbi:glycine zipper family protein [Chryseobacterium sp. C-71]|uniref:glycine zipper family protein n=1 Tax=Chryseobacterium sp. C-71 TaxID=2893882 RepID=UPI001E49F15A|nr:glycine zipper family protein [Chryseobacterium sp. C-71]UFH30535.1 glycine zipper family protein [Chryseobacterium sp. C-71]
MMKKTFFLLFFTVLLSAQETIHIDFRQSLKDRNSRTKSLTVKDIRQDKNIGSITNKRGTVDIKLAEQDVSDFFSKKFSEDNKTVGSNDITVLLEDLKIYNEQAPNDNMNYAKAKIKISSFLKRNDKYYFIDRFDNVFVEFNTDAKVAKNLAQTVSDIIMQFIKNSCTSPVSGYYIPEEELENYNAYLSKSNKSLNENPLKEGIYLNYKSFFEQTPNQDHTLVKNKKGEVKKIHNKQDLSISMSEVFCYVDNGIQYISTAAGFKEVKKNDIGSYIHASRAQMFPEKSGTGAMVGAMAGGIVGAAVGAAIDSGSNRSTAKGYGFKNGTITKVYIDSLTGDFVFTE